MVKLMWLLFTDDDHPMQPTHHGSITAISNTSDAASGSFMAPSDFATPEESVSVPVAQLEEVILSEPVTLEPNDASTPHQLVKMYKEYSILLNAIRC